MKKTQTLSDKRRPIALHARVGEGKKLTNKSAMYKQHKGATLAAVTHSHALERCALWLQIRFASTERRVAPGSVAVGVVGDEPLVWQHSRGELVRLPDSAEVELVNGTRNRSAVGKHTQTQRHLSPLANKCELALST